MSINKTALLTGATGGIGRAVAIRLAQDGINLALADYHQSGLSQLGWTNCKPIILQYKTFPGDLTNSDYADQLPAQVQRAMGSVDILINNAGLMRRGAITAATDEDFSLSMAVNVEAPFRLTRSVIPLMAANGGGAIVNTASCWGVRPGPDHLIYCVTKAGAGFDDPVSGA